MRWVQMEEINVTPLVAEMVKWNPDPEMSMWFDASGLDGDSLVNLDVVNETPLPFKQCAVCGIDGDAKWLFIVREVGETVAYIGWTLHHNSFTKHPAFTYTRTEGHCRVDALQGEYIDKELVRGIMANIGAWLLSLSTGAVAYEPKARKSLINSKRAARGKGPILFDWHTVNIEPKKPSSESQGGTHASPRRHQCRGHWRNCKSGKRVWVKDCWRGDASKGTVFKDYKCQSNANN